MATTPQWVVLQNSVRIEFAHTHLHTTPFRLFVLRGISRDFGNQDIAQDWVGANTGRRRLYGELLLYVQYPHPMGALKTQDREMTDKITGVENAGQENVW